MRLVILLSLAPFCVAQDKPPDFFRLPPHLKLWEGFPPPVPQAKPPVPEVAQRLKPPTEPCVHMRVVKPPSRDPGITVVLPQIRNAMPVLPTPRVCPTR